jgi:iron-sulfur cluster repair protein YtfE (RIC family)
MNRTTTPSDVFDQVMEEHNALRNKVSRIHTLLASPEPARDEIETLLREFLNALLVHFSNEENDGFFDDVTAYSPRLAGRAGMLCGEHKQMLSEADELRRFAAAGSPSMPWWRELSSRCHEFSKRLMRHEHKENELLQEAYQTDIGAND